MSLYSIEICKQKFDESLESFSFTWPFREIDDMAELKLLSKFSNLKSANFEGTNINDEGLSYVVENEKIEELDLQDTKISDEGIRYLSKLKNLKYLRLKENPQLTNQCIKHLNLLINLEDLQIHSTIIDENGLKNLILPNLKDLIVDEWNKKWTFDFLIDLSNRLTGCTILVKGRGSFYMGNFDGEWHDKTLSNTK